MFSSTLTNTLGSLIWNTLRSSPETHNLVPWCVSVSEQSRIPKTHAMTMRASSLFRITVRAHRTRFHAKSRHRDISAVPLSQTRTGGFTYKEFVRVKVNWFPAKVIASVARTRSLRPTERKAAMRTLVRSEQIHVLRIRWSLGPKAKINR